MSTEEIKPVDRIQTVHRLVLVICGILLVLPMAIVDLAEFGKEVFAEMKRRELLKQNEQSGQAEEN